MKTKNYHILSIMVILLVLITGCSRSLDELDGALLIKKYDIAGKYKVQITPKMMGVLAITTGEHDAELIDEGDGKLRLKYKGFQRPPMPFQMSVNVLMRIKPGPNGGLKVENMGGNFDADLPKGTTVIDPKKIPPGIEVPKDALVNGLHSNGLSVITGNYKMMDNPDGSKAMNFDWQLEPGIGLPVVISIRTNKKIK